MKSILFISILTLLLCNCSSKEFKTSGNYPESANEAIEDILGQWKILSDGVEELNAYKIFSIFSLSDSMRYVRNGIIYTSLHKVQKEYLRMFESIDIENRTMSFSNMNFNILSDNCILMTTIGEIKDTLRDGSNSKPWRISYTVTWTYENEAWKILNIHLSWK